MLGVSLWMGTFNAFFEMRFNVFSRVTNRVTSYVTKLLCFTLLRVLSHFQRTAVISLIPDVLLFATVCLAIHFQLNKYIFVSSSTH